MEDVALEVPVGEPAALPTRPRNRHKRERDVSHLCPTSVRLAQRKDEILKAWRNKKLGISTAVTANTGDEFHSATPVRNVDSGKKSSIQTQVSSETDDSKDEYTLSEEEENIKTIQTTYTGAAKNEFPGNSFQNMNCNQSGTFPKKINIRSEYW